MTDVREDQEFICSSRRGSGTRRRSGCHRRACCRCAPRTAPPSAARARAAPGRTPSLRGSSWSGTESSPADPAACADAGVSSASVMSRCNRNAVAHDVQVVRRGSRRRAARSASLIQASRRFHSRGTSQSNTCVPDGTSVTSSGTRRPTAASVCPHAVARDAAAEGIDLLHQLPGPGDQRSRSPGDCRPRKLAVMDCARGRGRTPVRARRTRVDRNPHSPHHVAG